MPDGDTMKILNWMAEDKMIGQKTRMTDGWDMQWLDEQGTMWKHTLQTWNFGNTDCFGLKENHCIM